MKYLNEILIEWDNNPDIEDSGIIKASDVENQMKYQLVYKIDESGFIKIFNSTVDIYHDNIIYSEYKDKVYINSEHVQLDEDGYTVNEYEPGEYRVYIEGFDKVKEIDKYTFYQCENLTSVTIPNSVTSIGKSAFWYCSGLTSVTIPNSVTEIGEFAFDKCLNLQTVYVEDINKFKRIQFESALSNPTFYGAKLIQLK